MPQGFEVYNENGQRIVSLNARITRILGQVTLDGAGELTIAEAGTPFAFLTVQNVFGQVNVPRITITGSTISWTAGTVTAILTYGVY